MPNPQSAPHPTASHDAQSAVAPDRPQMMSATLAGRDDLGRGYHVLRFDTDVPLEARAGHFVMIRSEAWGTAPLLPRPMSLLTAGAQPSMLIKVVGEGTRRMAEAPLGERFALLAPLGTPWPMPVDGHRPVVVAGGVGLPPILYLARELAARGYRAGAQLPSVTALFGGRTAGDLPLADELAATAELGVTTEDGSRGTKGLITVLLAHALEQARASGERLQIYACGPHPMMAAVADAARRHDMPCCVSLEALMGCGYGVCLGCAVPRASGGYLYACTEGPCVDAREVDWQKGGQP
jgi:dihydroorotate dehydrogenase electron transfer subunit